MTDQQSRQTLADGIAELRRQTAEALEVTEATAERLEDMVKEA